MYCETNKAFDLEVIPRSELCSLNTFHRMRFEVLTDLKISTLVFLVLTLCGLLHLSIFSDEWFHLQSRNVFYTIQKLPVRYF